MSVGKDAICLISVSGNRVGRWMPELGGGGAGRRKGMDSQAGRREHWVFFLRHNFLSVAEVLC